MRTLVILRPEPGASRSAARASALGLNPVVCPLFVVEPVGWTAPDPDRFDALLLTSANAVRHAGPALAALASLPVIAVGDATAAAAREAGLAVCRVGTSGVEALLGTVPLRKRLLHLAGEDRLASQTGHSIEVVTVYCAAAIAAPPLLPLAGAVVAVHSPRASARLAELTEDRSATMVAAISEAAAAACGSGWERVDWAPEPSDSGLLALAARLCQSRRR
ncbi:MAG: uroporphyrinogen-III synthase [Pseudomonadota bacterium]|nr:uroporphyrinogen-III synthase [Pseudomonadota bacterium]